MSLQVFLQAKLLGAPEFLQQKPSEASSPVHDFLGRCSWLTLFCEVLPRALLAELSLSRMLLGSSSAEQFLLVLAEEDIQRAETILSSAAREVALLSSGALRLVWGCTENLGSWAVASKRLEEALRAHLAAPLSASIEDTFEPFTSEAAPSYFSEFGEKMAGAESVGWSSENPGQLQWNGGTRRWTLTEQAEADGESIVFARRLAQSESGQIATPGELAQRAEGAQQWGLLLGDVDHFGPQLRRQGTVEEHIHFSILFKEFFAGELAVLCTLPDFWRKVTVLYRGGNNFAVLGSWDALLHLGREIQRLFARFAEENLQTAANQDGKTISMALAIADEGETLPRIYGHAASGLREAKVSGADMFHLFGRTLEWKRVADAEELKTSLVRLVKKHGYSPVYIHELAGVYRESAAARTAVTRRKTPRVDKPWRTYMRLAQVIPQARGKEVNNLRNTVISSLIGMRTAALKLRPSGRVGLEWARLATASAK